MIKIFILILTLFCTQLFAQEGNSSPRLEQGTYFGYLKSNLQNVKFALQAEFYIESPEDFTQFPHLNTIIKINLGGFNSPEYITQVYKNIQYDFDNNTLTLDEPNNDLVISAQIKNENGRTKIVGDVWIRSAAQSGSLELLSASDEPDFFIKGLLTLPTLSSPSMLPPTKKTFDLLSSDLPLAPKVDGQYVGRCKNNKALFQIQTMRGLNDQNSRDGKQLFDYEIVGRLGFLKKNTQPNDQNQWETNASFSGGNYNVFTGGLLFLGPSSNAIDCNLLNGTLKCNFRSRDEIFPCELTLENRNDLPLKTYPRLFHVNPQNDQLKELPPANPPSNVELSKALGGHFVGYLHHESLDRYQAMALHVFTSSSTDNPHNPNKMFISTTSILYYGRTPSDLFITQRYEPRSFYLRPGFTLGAPGTDSFIIIQDWRQGYIRGVWYSQNFGRVGTIELIKSNELPALPAQAKIMPSWQGEFEGPFNNTKEDGFRWFRILFPNQPSERIESTVNFSGAYLSNKTVSTITPMDRGRFDPYTGAIGWVFSVNNGLGMISGKLSEDKGILLYWPPYPNVFAASMGNYKLELYK